jgi:hypothetical protein
MKCRIVIKQPSSESAECSVVDRQDTMISREGITINPLVQVYVKSPSQMHTQVQISPLEKPEVPGTQFLLLYSTQQLTNSKTETRYAHAP